MIIIILGSVLILFVLWCMLKVASIADNNFENANLDLNKIQKK